MPNQKIDRVMLHDMLKAGKTQKECAAYFGVSEVAIWKAKKELNLAVVTSVTLEAGHRILEGHIDAVSQLRKINDRANAILDGLMDKIENEEETSERKKDLREIALKAMSEIRNQLSLQVDVLRTLYDVSEVAEFQKIVIEEIGACEPEVRNRIVERLKRARALRGSVQIRP